MQIDQTAEGRARMQAIMIQYQWRYDRVRDAFGGDIEPTDPTDVLWHAKYTLAHHGVPHRSLGSFVAWDQQDWIRWAMLCIVTAEPFESAQVV